MYRKGLLISFIILCIVSLSTPKSLLANGRPDVTRHEANFLERAVNVHVEWQSPNLVVLVKISVAGVEREIKIDAYDNKRNRDGYAGEVNVTLGLELVPNQPFTYVIQLEDELRIKSPLVTGKVNVPPPQQPQYPHQPSMEIQIQQNIPKPGAKPGTRPGSKPGAQPAAKPGGQRQQVGSVLVIIGPQNIAEAGAMWRVENGPWKKSGEVISNLPVGVHTIEFQEVSDWVKPENQQVMIEEGQTVTVNGIYDQ